MSFMTTETSTAIFQGLQMILNGPTQDQLTAE